MAQSNTPKPKRVIRRGPPKPIYFAFQVTDASGNVIEGASVEVRAITTDAKTVLDAVMKDRNLQMVTYQPPAKTTPAQAEAQAQVG